jgi:hypothetical protein
LTYAGAIQKVEAAVSKEVEGFKSTNVQPLAELDLSEFA